MKNKITENTIEEFAIDLPEKSGYQYIFAPSIVPKLSACDAQTGSVRLERDSFNGRTGPVIEY